MSLYSTTLQSQPPPLHPRSDYDVASFDSLTKSLRQHPDLSSESEKILNSSQLAKLVDGIRRFQDDHLGVKNKYRPALRLPTPLLHDRSTSGPLYVAITSAFKVKQSSPWRNFNFDNPKLYDDNIALLKRMEGDLITAGLLKRPRVYFDTSISMEMRGGLSEIAEKYGASVTSDESEIMAGKVTHIVVYDPEEQDTDELIAKEQGEEREKKFLRTLGVFDIPIDGEGDAVVTKRMALVHWWYFPSSFDEWMNAEDVSGELEKDNISVGPGGAAVVGCKFIRDVEKFNEWGVESDYAVIDFERKLEYLRNNPNAMASSSSSNKKRKKQTAAGTGSDSESLSNKAKRGSFNSVDSANGPNRAPISEQKSKEAKPFQSTRTISERRIIKDTDVIGARRIQTGYKGARGEVIRRTVYDGALRVDENAYKIVRDALAEFVSGEAPLLSAKPEWRKFLPMNALVRPTVDTQLGRCITVTEITVPEEVGGGAIAKNREVSVLTCLDSQLSEGNEALRIRGGGTDEHKEVENQDTQAMEVEDKNEGIVELNQQSAGGNEDLVMGEAPEENVQVATEDPTSCDTLEADTKEEVETEPISTFQKSNEAVLTNVIEPSPAAPPDEKDLMVAEKKELSIENNGLTSQPHQEKEMLAPLPQCAPEPSSAAALTASTASADAVKVASFNPNAEKSSKLCEIKALGATQQLSSSLYNPNTTSIESAQVSVYRPSWYDQSTVSDFEQRSLPEWFNQSAPHRTQASYISTREQILDLAKKNPNQCITATALRRSLTCDSGSIMRLHSFLTDWNFINSEKIGDAAPSTIRIRNMRATWNEAGKNVKRKFDDVEKSIIWSPARLELLEKCVIASILKKRGIDGRSVIDVDWEKVAANFGGGVTAKECQFMFVQPSNGLVKMPAADGTSAESHESFYSKILVAVRPEILKQVIDASLTATEDLVEAKNASVIGAIASVAAEKGLEEERQIRATMMDIIDQRVKRIENRIALMDDIEALLEAERVSLELERRDMYTTRCRQWFGNGST